MQRPWQVLHLQAYLLATAASGTNTTQIATTAFVQAAVTGAGSYNDAAVDTHLNTSTAASGEVLSWNGSDYDWVAQTGGGGGGEAEPL